MNARHTLGSWQVNSTDPRQVCDTDGEMRGCAPIAHCVGSDAKANARLIAAAPQLLTALCEMLAWAKSVEGTEVSRGITEAGEIFQNACAVIRATQRGAA